MLTLPHVLLLFVLPFACTDVVPVLRQLFRVEAGGLEDEVPAREGNEVWSAQGAAAPVSSDTGFTRIGEHFPRPSQEHRSFDNGAGQMENSPISSVESASLFVKPGHFVLSSGATASQHDDGRGAGEGQERKDAAADWLHFFRSLADASRPRPQRPVRIGPALQALRRMAPSRQVSASSSSSSSELLIEQGLRSAAPLRASVTTMVHTTTSTALMLALVILVTNVCVIAFSAVYCTEGADQQESSGIVARARGQSRWLIFGCAVTTSMSFAAFLLTFPVVQFKDKAVTESFKPHAADEKALCAFIAGAGVALCASWAQMLLLSFRYAGKVPISRALLAVFFLRGTGLSLVVALGLETLGLELVEQITGQEHTQPDWDDSAAPLLFAVVTLIVGCSEEFAKLAAVFYGVWILAPALRRSHEDGSMGCLSRQTCVLIESPKSMLLAGLAAGFGFMTIENAGYFVMVTSECDSKEASHEVQALMRVVVILVRIFLNLHPWLAGYSASQSARLIFASPMREAPALQCAEILRCMGLSAIIHGVYDFLVVVLPPPLALFVPYTCWVCARKAFISEWEFWNSEQQRAIEPHGTANVTTDADLPEGVAYSAVEDDATVRGSTASGGGGGGGGMHSDIAAAPSDVPAEDERRSPDASIAISEAFSPGSSGGGGGGDGGGGDGIGNGRPSEDTDLNATWGSDLTVGDASPALAAEEMESAVEEHLRTRT